VKLYRTEVVTRESFGDYVLISYRWAGGGPEPGQFVVARTTEPSTSLDPFLNRPFFVHDHEDGVATLFYEVRGRGTALLAQAAGEIFASAPLGRGFILRDTGPAALVGGGVGASPLGLVSKHLAQRGVPHDVYLVIPNHQKDRSRDWFLGLFPRARLVRIDASIPVHEQTSRVLGRYAAVYASGPESLLGVVKDAAGGIPCQLAVQEWMACANGSCYGCAVPVWESGSRTYARVCVEGPVFPAEALAW
jgi:dihydroorotate dehydrogenase electron transfer subunit